MSTVSLAGLAASPSPVKCLIVDDLAENLLAFSALLAGDDVEVLTARSGVAALDLLLRHDVALAVVDVQMPDMDGFELAELMRGSERTRHVPLIFVTAGLRDRHRVFKGYDSGAVDFLFKPIEPQILQNKAQVFFQLYRQKQQLQRELLERTETLRLNEMFVAVLSHDLRTPLGAMMTAADVLKFHSTDPLVLEIAGRMLSSGKRMLRMIEDMLDLARARLAGGIPLVRLAADMGSIVQRVVQEHQTAVPTRPIDVTTQGDPAGDWDVDRLAQVIANVVGNAVQHGIGDSPVRITIDGTGADMIHVLVDNEGTIDPSVLPHVFDPFRGGPRLSSRQGGLGLGLYIARQIVLAHDGHIEVRAEPAGHTTVELTIPRRSRAATSRERSGT